MAGAEAAYRAAESGSLVTLYEAAGPIVDRGSRRPHAPRPTRVGGGTALVVDDEGGFVAPTAAESLVAAGWKVEDRHRPAACRGAGRPHSGGVS